MKGYIPRITASRHLIGKDSLVISFAVSINLEQKQNKVSVLSVGADDRNQNSLLYTESQASQVLISASTGGLASLFQQLARALLNSGG